MAQFGADARPALPRLLDHLRGELGRCTTSIDYLVYAVRAIAPDPEAEIRQLVDSCDPDLRQQAEHLLAGKRTHNQPARRRRLVALGRWSVLTAQSGRESLRLTKRGAIGTLGSLDAVETRYPPT